MVGSPEAIDEGMNLFLGNVLVLKVVNGLQDHLSWEVRFSQDEKKA